MVKKSYVWTVTHCKPGVNTGFAKELATLYCEKLPMLPTDRLRNDQLQNLRVTKMTYCKKKHIVKYDGVFVGYQNDAYLPKGLVRLP